MPKLTLAEKILFGLLILVVAVTFTYIVRTRMMDANNNVSVEIYDFDDKAYDVEKINSASYDDFVAVKGIGSVKATAIVEYREAIKGFDSVYQLLDLTSISDSNFEAILDYFYSDREEVPEATELEPITEAVTTASEVTSSIATTTELTTPVTTASVTSTESVTTTEAAKETVTTSEEYEEIVDETEVIVEDEESATVPEMSYVYINSASAEEIAECLLIDYKLALNIVSMRDSIGGFNNTSELMLCDGMTNDIYKNILNFIIIS